MVIELSKNEQDTLACEFCHYITSRQSNLTRHKLTCKKRMVIDGNKIEHMCECGKRYKYSSGLCRHKRSCKYVGVLEAKDNKIDELLGVIKGLVPKIGNNNNSNNITFQIFLDEKCKDAMCLDKFMNGLTIKLQDLLEQKRLGYVGGVGNTIVKSLKELKLEERPIHCTDMKEGIFYIKGDEGWRNETGEKITEVIENTENKAIIGLNKIWEEEFGENWQNSEEHTVKYMEVLSSITKKPTETELQKIKSNICKSVYVKINELVNNI